MIDYKHLVQDDRIHASLAPDRVRYSQEPVSRFLLAELAVQGRGRAALVGGPRDGRAAPEPRVRDLRRPLSGLTR
jgi:hypothetical protein